MLDRVSAGAEAPRDIGSMRLREQGGHCVYLSSLRDAQLASGHGRERMRAPRGRRRRDLGMGLVDGAG